MPKVEAARDRLTKLNPYIEVDPVPLSITDVNAQNLIGDVDVVVDALDSMRARYAVNRACHELSKPLIHGAATTGPRVNFFFLRLHAGQGRGSFPFDRPPFVSFAVPG